MPTPGKLYTIGYNKGNAELVIKKLKAMGLSRVIDIRLWPSLVSMLKADFDYKRLPEFAPTREIITYYRDHGQDWPLYEKEFKELMVKRKPLSSKQASDFDDAVLICAERSPLRCHRRLVAKVISDQFGHEIVHL